MTRAHCGRPDRADLDSKRPNTTNKLLYIAQSGAIGALSLIVALGLSACTPAENPSTTDEPPGAEAASTQDTGPDLSDPMAQASYSLGYTVSKNVSDRYGDLIDEDAFVNGIREAIDGTPARVAEATARDALTQMNQRKAEADQVAAEGTLAEGGEFMAENGAREGVTTLASGLQYEVLTPAEGDTPTAADTVTTHYEGRLIDGTVFDSSLNNPEPVSFPLNGVIPGWTEALQLMAVGAKWRLYIPPNLAYGNRAVGSIPPNSTLIFDVELLDISK